MTVMQTRRPMNLWEALIGKDSLESVLFSNKTKILAVAKVIVSDGRTLAVCENVTALMSNPTVGISAVLSEDITLNMARHLSMLAVTLSQRGENSLVSNCSHMISMFKTSVFDLVDSINGEATLAQEFFNINDFMRELVELLQPVLDYESKTIELVCSDLGSFRQDKKMLKEALVMLITLLARLGAGDSILVSVEISNRCLKLKFDCALP